MASINSYHVTEPQIDSLAVDDIFLVYDASTGRTGRAVSSQIQADVVATSSSTSVATMLGTGTTVISATAAFNQVLAAPTYTGQTKYIVQTTTATAAKTVTGTTAGGTTFVDSTKTALTFTVQGQAVILKAITATQWAIMANVGTVTSA